MLFFEDIEIGTRTRLGSHRFTEGEIIAFARAFDPQPFHLDPAAGARTHFGGLVASGWQSVAISARLRAQAWARQHEELRRMGRKVPRIGPSPGFRDLRWLRPVRPGDTLVFTSEVTAKKPSGTRPEWGLVFTRESAADLSGTPALEFTNCVFVERLEA